MTPSTIATTAAATAATTTVVGNSSGQPLGQEEALLMSAILIASFVVGAFMLRKVARGEDLVMKALTFVGASMVTILVAIFAILVLYVFATALGF